MRRSVVFLHFDHIYKLINQIKNYDMYNSSLLFKIQIYSALAIPRIY